MTKPIWATARGWRKSHAVLAFGGNLAAGTLHAFAVCGIAPQTKWENEATLNPLCKNCERELRKMEGTKR